MTAPLGLSLAEFGRRVQSELEAARGALERLEEAARRDDTPEIHEVSRLYAQFCMYARDYLSGQQIGRAFPRRLGQRLGELLASLQDHEALVEALSLTPNMKSLLALHGEAQVAH